MSGSFIVLVTGGRDYNEPVTIFLTLDALHMQRRITHLIHGDALPSAAGYRRNNGSSMSADRWAGTWAAHHGVQPVICPALWDYAEWGRSAGPRRNRAMAQLAPDVVVAFPGGVGTAGMIDIARRAGIEVRELQPD